MLDTLNFFEINMDMSLALISSTCYNNLSSLKKRLMYSLRISYTNTWKPYLYVEIEHSKTIKLHPASEHCKTIKLYAGSVHYKTENKLSVGSAHSKIQNDNVRARHGIRSLFHLSNQKFGRVINSLCWPL